MIFRISGIHSSLTVKRKSPPRDIDQTEIIISQRRETGNNFTFQHLVCQIIRINKAFNMVFIRGKSIHGRRHPYGSLPVLAALILQSKGTLTSVIMPDQSFAVQHRTQLFLIRWQQRQGSQCVQSLIIGKRTRYRQRIWTGRNILQNTIFREIMMSLGQQIRLAGFLQQLQFPSILVRSFFLRGNISSYTISLRGYAFFIANDKIR